ncbi:hypothetical protein FB567DRAFT_127771 [Paraphoma chrysanthemicola]|uniref:Uncharacterized protein n=1 Tax=Paraphoma chrysanthemicola TaxID=798071 RepID=A0A8K0R1N6_9PLEO|nr:hypothetical protein FB567DRAFT_127771 [Paraphoma chrysanthemicola]
MLTSSPFFESDTLLQLRTLKGSQRRDFVRKIWPDVGLHHNAFDEASCEAIIEHIVSELDRVRHHGRLFAAHNFEETFSIIQHLRENRSMTCRDVARTLTPQFPNATPEAIRRSIELSVRVWLTVNIHSTAIAVGSIAAGETSHNWAEDRSLDELLSDKFIGHSHGQQQIQRATFDPVLTAAYLVRVCGMKLRWTDDIGSHLAFDPRRLVLSIYRHKACLVSHLNKQQDCPLPVKVLEETLDTLDLLFPPWEASARQLLKDEGQQSLFTLGCRRNKRILDLTHYQCFGEALDQVMDAFDKNPRTWKQLALDRRNKLEWAAFWVTAMVAMLTLVSIPCNIIQATYSVKAYNLAVAQGRIGLAAA